MSFYEDLSEYEYRADCYRPRTKNVGWLAEGHDFSHAGPSEAFVAALWQFCKVSVAQTRGGHFCELCRQKDALFAKRGDEALLLGTAEIRVFAPDGDILAAPTLVYHYVTEHQYAPPASFVAGVLGGPAPPSPEYFDHLRANGLTYTPTSAPPKGGFRRLGGP